MAVPASQLAVFPGTTHFFGMARTNLVIDVVTTFLDAATETEPLIPPEWTTRLSTWRGQTRTRCDVVDPPAPLGRKLAGLSQVPWSVDLCTVMRVRT